MWLRKRLLLTTSVAALYAAAGGAATTPAQSLVDTWASGGAGSDGFAMVFEDSGGTDAPSIYVKDSGTPANDTDINLTDDWDALNSFLTYTAPSAKIVRQSDGDLKYCAHNLILQSNSFSTTWNNASGATLSSGQSDPDGGSNAWSYTAIADADTKLAQTITVVNGADYLVQVKAKYNVGNGFVRIQAGSFANVHFDVQNGTVQTQAVGTGSITDLGSGWYLLEVRGTSSSTSASCWFELTDTNSSSVADTGDSLFLYQYQVTCTPSDETYLPTTTAARYALPVQYDSSNNAEGLLVEPAATNLVTYSNDITNAAWTKSNMTTAKTATGPGGTANEATTCTASSGNATALFSITSSSAERITHAYIKRRTGTGNIDLTQDNGGTWTTVAVDGTWTRFALSPVTSANPTVGLRIVTSGDAVDVALFQHELGAVATSPIITTGATATRAADDLEVTDSKFPHSTTNNSLYFKGQYADAGTTNRNFIEISNNSDNNFTGIRMDSGDRLDVINKSGGVQDVNLSKNTVISANTDFKVAFAAAANDFAATDSGSAVSTDTAATMPVGSDRIIIPRNNIGSSDEIFLVKEILYLPERMSNADLASITT